MVGMPFLAGHVVIARSGSSEALFVKFLCLKVISVLVSTFKGSVESNSV